MSKHPQQDTEEQLESYKNNKQKLEDEDSSVKKFKHPSDLRPESTISSVQGLRDSMEDRHVTAAFGNLELNGIFDGHGGTDVATFVSKELSDALLPIFSKKEQDTHKDYKELERTVKDVFKKLDNKMFNKGLEAGSCALVSIFDKDANEMFLLNLGDSRAFLFSDDKKEVLETYEKTPEDADERKRIRASKRSVVQKSVKRIEGHLAVCRAFGDNEFKTPTPESDEYTGSKGAVSVEPIFHHAKLDPGKTYYLILGCDGLWSDGGIEEPFTNEELMDMIVTEKKLAKDLTEEAIRRGSGDNVTCMLLKYEL